MAQRSQEAVKSSNPTSFTDIFTSGRSSTELITTSLLLQQLLSKWTLRPLPCTGVEAEACVCAPRRLEDTSSALTPAAAGSSSLAQPRTAGGVSHPLTGPPAEWFCRVPATPGEVTFSLGKDYYPSEETRYCGHKPSSVVRTPHDLMCGG